MVGDDSSTRGNLKRDQDEAVKSPSPSSVSELVHLHYDYVFDKYSVHIEMFF